MMAADNEFERNSKVQKIRSLLSESGQGGWDRAWKEQCTPWDSGRAQIPLSEALKSPILRLPPTGRALVPGCGRGYDAAYIASCLGYDVLGIDLSPAAVEAAQDLLGKASPILSGKVTFVAADFFALSVPEDERFIVIYDYTFFCAIPPSLRGEWGEQMTKLTKPGGYLISLVFPIDGPRDGGPPYSVNAELYEEALGPKWEKLIDKNPDESSLSHVGRERLVIWQLTDGMRTPKPYT